MNTQAPNWTDMNRAFLEPMNRWNELAARNAEKLSQYGLTLVKDLVELSASQMQLSNEIEDPKKWVQSQTRLLTDYGQKLADRSGEYLALGKEIRESLWQWGEETAKASAEVARPKAA